MEESLRREFLRLNLIKFRCRVPVFSRFFRDRRNRPVPPDRDEVVEALSGTASGRRVIPRVASLYENTELDREIGMIEHYGASFVCYGEDEYPHLLKNIDNPPLILYYRGRLGRSDLPRIAVVGSRRATRYGRDMAGRLGRGLADAGVDVVSGLARGIDTSAHKGALSSASGRTLAVLGSGIDVVYPRENLALAQRIVENGAVVTEFPMGTGPRAWHFPARNRIISGLCAATVVVEAHRKSGSLITAGCAAQQGRDVFAVPGDVGREGTVGTNSLIREGAGLVSEPRDVLDSLGLSSQRAKTVEPLLEGDAALVLRELKNGAGTMDALVEACDLDFLRFNRAVADLVQRGIITRDVGGCFTPALDAVSGPTEGGAGLNT